MTPPIFTIVKKKEKTEQDALRGTAKTEPSPSSPPLYFQKNREALVILSEAFLSLVDVFSRERAWTEEKKKQIIQQTSQKKKGGILKTKCVAARSSNSTAKKS